MKIFIRQPENDQGRYIATLEGSRDLHFGNSFEEALGRAVLSNSGEFGITTELLDGNKFGLLVDSIPKSSKE